LRRVHLFERSELAPEPERVADVLHGPLDPWFVLRLAPPRRIDQGPAVRGQLRIRSVDLRVVQAGAVHGGLNGLKELVDDAIRIANLTIFGLSSSVWTNNPGDERYFVERLDAGAAFINGMTVSYPELPFGGIKASGFGRKLAAAVIREFTNLKTVWKPGPARPWTR
jgi:hypothetical protein